MYPHTSTKIKLKKQMFLIDIFYNNYKENLYKIFGSMLCKVVGGGTPQLLNRDRGSC